MKQRVISAIIAFLIFIPIFLKGGMLFNNRRLSKDRELIKHIMQMVDDQKLWINSFSSKLFEEYIREKELITLKSFVLK